MRARFGCTLAVAVGADGAHARVPIWSRQGTPLPVVTALTGPLAVIGDVDADGHDELMQYVGGSMPPQGLWIFSGRDGVTLRMQPPPCQRPASLSTASGSRYMRALRRLAASATPCAGDSDLRVSPLGRTAHPHDCREEEGPLPVERRPLRRGEHHRLARPRRGQMRFS